MNNGFRGSVQLLRFALRRDRIMLPVWVFVYLSYTVAGAAAAVVLYPDIKSRMEAVNAINNLPSMIALYGRVWDPNSLGALAMVKPIGFGGVFAAILAIMLVTRHLRGEEEAGRLELISAQQVGRYAPATAAFAEVVIAMTAIAVLNGIGLQAAGLPAAGGWVFGLSVGLAGLVFGGLSLLYSQITTSARSANSFAFIELAIAFLIRATADTAGDANSSAWWVWLSPIGWQQQVRAYAGDIWWPLLLPVIATVVLVSAAFWIAGDRDYDTGLITVGNGRSAASIWLRSPLALGLRLQRGFIIGLLVSFAMLALILGSIVNNITSMLDSPEMKQWIQAIGGSADMIKAFTAFELSFAAYITAAVGVSLARRIGTEEQAGRTEPLLATAVSTRKLLTSFGGIALLVTALLQLVLGLGCGITAGAQLNDYSGLGTAVLAALAYLPAIWLVLGITLRAISFRPFLGMLGWIAVVASLLIDEFGVIFKWPGWVLNLSPFSHVPRMPSADFSWPPMLWLSALTVFLLLTANFWYHRRDLISA